MSNILISPLGRSPGAVSGVYYALRERKHPIDRVVVVGTSHPDVLTASRGYLEPLFDYLKVGYEAIYMPEKELRSEKRSVMPYAAMIGLAVENTRQDGQPDRVHVAVTGGRSGMGAMAALAAQVYDADHLWHLWVGAEIEQGGVIDKLEGGLVSARAMDRSPFLNPTVWGEEAWDLVDLPLTKFNPASLQRHLQALRKNDGAAPHVGADVFAPGFDLQTLFDVFPSGMTFCMADELLEHIRDMQQVDDPGKRDKILVDIGALLQRAGVVEATERDNLLNVLQSDRQWKELLAVERRDRAGLWGWLKKNYDPVQAATSLTQVFLTGLELWAKATGRLPS